MKKKSKTEHSKNKNKTLFFCLQKSLKQIKTTKYIICSLLKQQNIFLKSCPKMDTDLMAVNVWNTNSFKLFSKKIFLKLLNYYEREMYLIPSLNIFLCDFLLFFCNYFPNFFPPVTLYPPSLPGPRPRGQPGSPPWLSTWLVLRPDSGP